MTRAAVPHDFLETNLCPCAQNELGKRTYYLMLVVPARYQCYKVKGMPCVHLLFFRPLYGGWWWLCVSSSRLLYRAVLLHKVSVQ